MISKIIEIILALLWFYGTFFSAFSKMDGVLVAALIYGMMFLLPIVVIEVVKKNKKNKPIQSTSLLNEDNNHNTLQVSSPQKDNKPKEQIKPKYTQEQKTSKGMWRVLQIFSIFIIVVVGFTYVYSQGWIDKLQSEESIKVSRINAFQNDKCEIMEGEEITFELTALPSRLNADKVNVKSSDETVLEVKNTIYQDNGNHTVISIVCLGKNEGNATITVSDNDGDKSVSTVVNVLKAPLVNNFSKFEDSNVLMVLGTTETIVITASASELSNDDVYIKTPEGANVSIENILVENIDNGSYKISFNVVGNTTGWCELRVVANDEKTVSEKIKVTVVEEWMLRTVWVNYAGDKYHYSKSCAGDSATETTLYEASKYKEPCSKCAK